MKTCLILLFLFNTFLPDFSPVAKQTIIDGATVSFKIKNAGIMVEGSLEGLEAEIDFDPLHPELAHIQASLPVSSIRTGIGLRDKHLQKPDYFDAKKHPSILLSSKAIRNTGRGKYEGVFSLTIKGIEKEVVLPFRVSAANELKGQLKVNRLDFGLGQESLVLANEVEVSIWVKVRGEAKSAFIHK